MTDKVKCSTETCERDATHKGLCSGCYGKQWREQRKAERAKTVTEPLPKQLTGDATVMELEAIEGEIVPAESPSVPETHLTALNPAQMQAAQSGMRIWLEQKLSVLERDIVEANAALNEARKNGWATAALTSARNRAVDDEAFYNKILIAVEAGHTIIPEFPISIFAIRTGSREKDEQLTYRGYVDPKETHLGRPARSDCSPAGIGKYRNPEPSLQSWSGTKRKDEQGEFFPYFVRRTGYSAGPIAFPSQTARSPIMQATAAAMKDKVFDQFGVCLPIFAAQASRRVETSATRAGDPLVIGQIVHKRVGRRQKVVSFIIAWHLNLNDL